MEFLMRKIISLFQRNYDGDRLVRNEVVPGAEWVLAGEGKATRKFDGTCCMVRDGTLYKRFEVKQDRSPPEHFEAACEVDPNTGKQQGWVPVGAGPEDKRHREAFSPDMPDGTYELCGPKVNGNPEKFDSHVLVSHGEQECPQCPRAFGLLREFFTANDLEGIVWHHQDGRMVKIKGKDFGVKRNA
jgi:hypothetical protein